MNKIKQCFLYGCLGGIILNVVDLICSTLVYISISNLSFEILLTTCITLGCAISIFVLLYKRSTVIEMILRFVVMIVSNFCFMLINAYIGTINYIYKLFNVHTSSVSDNVSGMLSGTFWVIVIGVCVIAIIVVVIKRILIKKTE